MFNPLWIKGKVVERVEMNPFDDGRNSRTNAHNPEIFFTDGSSIVFNTEETDQGIYGTSILYLKPRRGQ